MSTKQVEEWILKYAIEPEDAARMRQLLVNMPTREISKNEPTEYIEVTTQTDLHTAAVGNDTIYFDEEGEPTTDHESLVQDATARSEYLGRYEDLGVLGHGATGEVRRIKDLQLNRTVAIKILHQHLRKQPTAVSRFVEEAQVCAQLQHPNIVPIHELGQFEDGRMYFTMKEIKGKELKEIIFELHLAASREQWHVSESGWSLHSLIAAFLKVCEAVAYAHSKGVIHRDLKPKNIMLGPFGEVLVVDWGLAKIMRQQPPAVIAPEPTDSILTLRSHDDAYTTQLGQIAGTPSYMSPEQARGNIHLIDERSDVYSLGAVLYEVLTGKPPFYGDSLSDVMEQICTGDPISLRSQRTLIRTKSLFSMESSYAKPAELSGGLPLPEALVQVCEKALSRNPDDRYQSAAEMSEKLKLWLDIEQDMRRELIRDVAFLQHAPEQLLEELASSLTQSHFATGQVIFSEGEPGDDFWIIRSGRVLIQKAEEQLAELRPGDWFGEGALLSEAPRGATVVTAADTLLYRMTRKSFQYLLERYPQMQETVLSIYESRRLEQFQLCLRQELLQKVPFFAPLGQEILMEFAHVLQRLEHQGLICQEGDTGDQFYLLASGQVQLLRNGNYLTELSSGSYFGEGALLDATVRTATIVAHDPVILYVLKRQDFLHLIGKYPHVGEHVLASHQKRKASFVRDLFEQQLLRSVSFFRDAEAELIDALCQRLSPKVVDKGQVIFEQGAPGLHMYLVAKGSVAVFQETGKIAELDVGSCFGEMALLSDAPRNARIQALERTQLLCLGQQDFIEVMNDYPTMYEYIVQLQENRTQ